MATPWDEWHPCLLPAEYDIWTVDKATIMAYIKQRNAIRRTALLPLIDEQKEFDHTCTQILSARWRAFCRSKYTDYVRIQTEYYTEVDSPRSWTDGLSKSHEVDKRFKAFLRTHFQDEIDVMREIVPNYLGITRDVIHE